MIVGDCLIDTVECVVDCHRLRLYDVVFAGTMFTFASKQVAVVVVGTVDDDVIVNVMHESISLNPQNSNSAELSIT